MLKKKIITNSGGNMVNTYVQMKTDLLMEIEEITKVKIQRLDHRVGNNFLT